MWCVAAEGGRGLYRGRWEWRRFVGRREVEVDMGRVEEEEEALQRAYSVLFSSKNITLNLRTYV